MRLLPALLLVLAAPAFAGEDDHHHAEAPEGLEIGHGWMAATEGPDARVFMRVHNETGEDLVLTAVEVEGAAAVLVAPAIDGSGGTAPLLPYPLDAGAELEMTPDGPHIAITGLGPRAEGEAFDLVLAFEGLGEVEAHVDVEGPDAESESHAGHDH